ECSVPPNTSPKDSNYVHGYPKPSQLSPVLRNNHIHYNNEASGHQHQDRRHIPLSNPPERRHAPVQNYHNGGDRRHMPNLGDRRHISPPLHINICENSTNILNNSPSDVMHQRNIMDFSNSQRRHGRGKQVKKALKVKVRPVNVGACRVLATTLNSMLNRPLLLGGHPGNIHLRPRIITC
ncbi:GATA zinc finger domain-containing protein 14-like, partial [Asbolus verrucosus]